MKRLTSFLKKRRASRTASNPSNSGNAIAAQPAQQPLQQNAAQVSQAPAVNRLANTSAAQGTTLTVALQNQTSSSTVFAYITGRAIDQGNQWIIMRSDAVTPYYPPSPSGIMQPLQADCAIRLGPPGATMQAQIPHIAGGRIWFSIDQPIQFFLNPGPALVEPSVTNPSDPNAQLNWGFAEFTWNADQLYANISYVDFVSIPIALTLNTRGSGTQHVSGMNPSGLQQVANGLRQQASQDGVGWDQLIVNRVGSSQPLRVLSPNQGIVSNPNLFANYYDGYVNQVFQKYLTTPITIDTQSGSGSVSAKVTGGTLNFAGSVFSRPSTRDVFTCSTGPFATGSNPQTNAIIPRLAAAFNRSTLLVTNDFPAPLNLYYQNNITNHYSRIVHLANLDGKGYAFPYDDVQPSGGPDQSGEVHAGDPTLFTVAVGGNNAYVA
ncbi:hypothetical protein H2198_001672 [Neophaeococcomyces mojaviensis]|uniref:Uncharacterized protein n=1 Tax=Neophaeococcomyces mojaviensis TaxID=3383035 RepID=A0ACC3AGU7_9EURO|nr:hypothetical protein H2198_001672 [Knufia sp. JES_112]